jgi:hypothetical protein
LTTPTERTRFWSDTGTTVTVFTADEVDAIFVEAGETYTDAAAIGAYTRVIGLRRLLASSAKLTDYTQNQSAEKQSQVFDHLRALLTFWQSEANNAVAAGVTTSAARFGGQRRKPARLKEYPDN